MVLSDPMNASNDRQLFIILNDINKFIHLNTLDTLILASKKFNTFGFIM